MWPTHQALLLPLHCVGMSPALPEPLAVPRWGRQPVGQIVTSAQILDPLVYTRKLTAPHYNPQVKSVCYPWQSNLCQRFGSLSAPRTLLTVAPNGILTNVLKEVQTQVVSFYVTEIHKN